MLVVQSRPSRGGGLRSAPQFLPPSTAPHAPRPAPPVYVNDDKSAYAALRFHKYNVVAGLFSLMSSDVRAGISRSKELGIGGDFKGDGMQLGGSLAIAQGGRVLRQWPQQHFAHHPPVSEILDAFSYGTAASKPFPSQAEIERVRGPKPGSAAAAADCGCESKQ